MIILFIIILLLLFFFFIYISVLSLNLLWLVFHLTFSIFILGLINLYVIKPLLVRKGRKEGIYNFIMVYSICEVFSEVSFLLGFLLGFYNFLIVIILFKMGIYPFIYYFYLIPNLPVEYLSVRYFYLLYIIINDVWSYLLISFIPVNLNFLFSLITFFSTFLILGLNKSLPDLLIRSFIFNNLILIILFLSSSKLSFLVIYMLLSNWIKMFVLDFTYFNKSSYSLSYFSIISFTLLNGNPIFLYNLIKLYIFSLILNQVGGVKIILLIIIGFIFLISSMYFLVSSYDETFIALFQIKKGVYYFTVSFTLTFMVLFFNSSLFSLSILDFIIGGRFNYPSSLSQGSLGSISYMDYEFIFISNFCLFFILFFVYREVFINCYFSLNSYFSILGVSRINVYLRLGEIDIFQTISYSIPVLVVVYNLGCNCLYIFNSSHKFLDMDSFIIFSSFQWGWVGLYFSFILLYDSNYFYSIDNFIYNSLSLRFNNICKIRFSNNFINQFFNPYKTLNCYGGGCNIIILPVGRSLRLATTSLDVIHSFWIPGMGLKMDSEPGKVNLILLHIGNFASQQWGFYCSELCGVNHSTMGGCLYLLDEIEFGTLLEEGYWPIFFIILVKLIIFIFILIFILILFYFL